MPLPPFRNDGVLPVGDHHDDWEGDALYRGHSASLAEVRDRFVESEPDSDTRPILFTELERHFDLARKLLKCFTVLVSGEFVTGVVSPLDITIVLQATGQTFEEIPAHDSWILKRIYEQGNYQIGVGTCDVTIQVVRIWPSDHFRHKYGAADLNHALLICGEPTGTSGSGGYVEIYECEGGDVNDGTFKDLLAEPAEASPEHA